MTWRKKLFSEMSDAEIECMNYIDKQRIYSPDYPSLKYYYEIGEPVSLIEANLPDGYMGEICWFRSNKIYYTDTDFSLVKTNCTEEEMTEDSVKRMFVEYVYQTGMFSQSGLESEEDIEKAILGSLWPRYKYDCNWEYHSVDDIEHYDFTVNFHLA